MTYPRFEELGAITPDYLDFGERYMRALETLVPKTTVRELPQEERRAYDRTQRRNWAGRRKLGGERIA